MKKLIATAVIISTLVSCSTAGGWYKKGDAKHGEFSAVNSTLAVVGAAVIVVGAAAAGKNSAGGGSNSYAESGADWDAFYNQYGQLVWACRDIRTGRFTEAANCAGKAQTDSRWPSK